MSNIQRIKSSTNLFPVLTNVNPGGNRLNTGVDLNYGILGNSNGFKLVESNLEIVECRAGDALYRDGIIGVQGHVMARKPDGRACVLAVMSPSLNKKPIPLSAPYVYWIPVNDDGTVSLNASLNRIGTSNGATCTIMDVPLPNDKDVITEAISPNIPVIFNAKIFWDPYEGIKYAFDEWTEGANELKKLAARHERDGLANLETKSTLVDSLVQFQRDAFTKYEAERSRRADADAKWEALSLADKEALLVKWEKAEARKASKANLAKPERKRGRKPKAK